MIPDDDNDALRDVWCVCEALSGEDEALKREILDHAANRWAMGILYRLVRDGRMRHAELARRLDGITQRMLTRTLRQLERDGMLVRNDHGEIPPRVDYEIADLGVELLRCMTPLAQWVVASTSQFKAARDAFDATSRDATDGTALIRRSVLRSGQ